MAGKPVCFHKYIVHNPPASGAIMKLFRYGKIRSKIFFSTLICVLVPTLLLSVYLVYQAYEASLANRRYAQSQIEESMVRSLQYEIKMLDNAAYNIFGNFGMLEDIEQGKDEDELNFYKSKNSLVEIFGIYSSSSGHDGLLGINLYDTHNSLVSYYLVSRPARMQGSIPDRYQLYDQQTALYGPRRMLHFQQDDMFNQEILRYYYPLLFRGNYIGYLEFCLAAREFRATVESFNQLDDGMLFITTVDGMVLYDSPAQSSGLMADTVLPQRDNTITKALTGIDAKLIYLYNDSPATKLSVFITAGVLGLALTITAAITVATSKRLSEPIVQLTETVRLVEAGDYDARVSLDTGDEIGELGRIINKMTAAIREHIAFQVASELAFKNAQLSTLQAQISPHFLHNTLHAVTEMAYRNSAEDITAICKALSDMYRYNMDIEQRYDTLGNEMMNVRNYMLIISRRYPKAIRFSVRLPADLRPLPVPKLILQPIVENAVEHGLLSSPREDKLLEIAFEADTASQLLQIYVRDNGQGMEAGGPQAINERLGSDWKEPDGSSGSIGIYNVQRRIRMLCGDGYGLHMESAQGKGTCISFRLPLTGET